MIFYKIFVESKERDEKQRQKTPNVRKWSPKVNKSEPKGAKREPKGNQRERKRPKREPKGSQMEPKGPQRQPKGVQNGGKMVTKTIPGTIFARSPKKVIKQSPKWYPQWQIWEPAPMKNQWKNRCENRCWQMYENSMRKRYRNWAEVWYVLIFFKIEFKFSESVECAKTIVLMG